MADTDGNCSEPFECASLGLKRCVGSNVICTARPGADHRSDACDVVDALTGRVLAHTQKESLVDSSGAHVWYEPERGLFASNAPGANACQLLDSELLGVRIVFEFRFGVLIVSVGSHQNQVVRFDGNAYSDAEPDYKVSRTVV